MPTLTINGKAITVPPGTSVFNACKLAGIYVPNYCYHPGLSIAGNCRVCQVEIKGQPKPAISCNTPCADNMEVFTTSDKALKARKGVMEFLLANHPLDCPTCDQAGECDLQNFAASENQLVSRFDEDKLQKPRENFGPHVQYVPNRCILCSRCVRFCDEISGIPSLGIVERGSHAEIALAPGAVLDDELSANVADVCPVGALLTRDHLHDGRAWFLKRTPSTCPSCSRGCSVFVDAFRDRVTRMRARHNPRVNDYWMCDIGRFHFDFLNDPQRLKAPLHRGKAVAWDDALRLLKEQLGNGACVAGSAWSTSEENLLLSRLGRPAGFLAAPDGPGRTFKKFTIDADRNPNRRGVGQVLGAEPGARFEQGAPALLLHTVPGHVPAETEASGWERAGFRAVLGILPSRFSETADLVLPVASFAETEGTFVNSQGHVQWIRPATACQDGIREAWRVLAGLAGVPARDIRQVHALLPETLREAASPATAAAGR